MLSAGLNGVTNNGDYIAQNAQNVDQSLARSLGGPQGPQQAQLESAKMALVGGLLPQPLNDPNFARNAVTGGDLIPPTYGKPAEADKTANADADKKTANARAEADKKPTGGMTVKVRDDDTLRREALAKLGRGYSSADLEGVSHDDLVKLADDQGTTVADFRARHEGEHRPAQRADANPQPREQHDNPPRENQQAVTHHG